MVDVSQDSSSAPITDVFRSPIIGAENFTSYYTFNSELMPQDESVERTSQEAKFSRSLLRSSSGIDALQPYSDVVIRTRGSKISPSPIGERAETNKMSPSHLEWGLVSPPRHIGELFGSSNPFNGVLLPKEIECHDAELDFQFEEFIPSPRIKPSEEENMFGMDPLMDSIEALSNAISPRSSPDQDATILQGAIGDSGSYGEHPLGEHPSRTLFVRNINSNVEDDELRALFEQYGPIRSMYTQCKHRGFVMISYYDIRHAKNAMRHLQAKVLRRRKLDIHYSIPKENPSEKDQNQGTLVVFNLDPATMNEELKAIFETYGEIKEVRETPNKKHHKFIEFYDVRDAEKAMKILNKTEIRGKKIKIEPSRPGGVRKGMNTFSLDQYSEDEQELQSFYPSAPQSLGAEEMFVSYTPSNNSYPPLQHNNMPKYKANILGSPQSSGGNGGVYRPIKSPQQASSHSTGVFNSPNYPRSPPMEPTLYSPRTLSPAPVQPPIWNSNKGFPSSTISAFSPSPQSPPQTPTFGSSDGKFREKSPETETKPRRTSDAEDKSRFKLILSKVGMEDSRTTLMIKNIPNKYNQKMLLAAVDEKHKGTYDFFYLPIDFKNKCNVGYAFINFSGYEFIRSFYEEFNNKKWEKFNSEKVCNITYARIQGKNALVQHFQNSSLMCEDKKCRPIIFQTTGEQEIFPIGTNLTRRRNSDDSQSWTSEDEQ
jgi:RNA recognition motif-containing protein